MAQHVVDGRLLQACPICFFRYKHRGLYADYRGFRANVERHLVACAKKQLRRQEADRKAKLRELRRMGVGSFVKPLPGQLELIK